MGRWPLGVELVRDDHGRVTAPASRWSRGDRQVAAIPSNPDGMRELATLAFAAVVYFGGRVLVEGSSDAATRNAQRLIDFERSIGLDVELAVQEFALDHSLVRVVGNFSYVWLHWPLLLAILATLYRLDRRRYLQLRNAMFASGLCGLVLFATFPMSPPRFMPGFLGTVSDEARRHYLSYPLSWTNRFAAFPSFHVGWTLIACMALASSLQRDHLRWVSLVPAALVAVAVVSTANHYIIDAVVGGAIALIAYLAFGHRRFQPRQTSLITTREPT